MQKQLQKIIENSPNSDSIKKAFEFAQTAHRGQKRLSGEDYILHPLRVAKILSGMHLDARTVAAGFLHDVADDTEKTLKDIEKEFGKEVAFLVGGVSKLGKLRYPKETLEEKLPGARAEKPINLRAESFRKMFIAMAEDLRVILIKLADRLDNMQTLGAVPPEKQKRIALETTEIFAPLANRLGMGDMKGQLEDLAFPYLYPKEYEWLIRNVKEEYKERIEHLKKAKPILIKILKKEGIKPIDVHSRPKHYWSLYQKLLKHDMAFDRIYDLIAIRVIVNDVKTCYQALGVIHKSWKPLIGRIKDYISSPKPNGYQALHTTVICSCGERIIEIQIKTEKMHEEAEYGIAAHWAAKEGINLKTEGRRFTWVRQLKDWQLKILKPDKEDNLKERSKEIPWLQELKDWQTGVVKPEEFFEGLKIDFFKKRIFIFTPKGDVIDLPEGATPVDFAYAVHTEIGSHCAGAKVNGKMAPLSKILKNGDIVEIIVDKNKRPSRDWLLFVKTRLARSQIKSGLKQGGRLEGFKNLFKKAEAIRALPKTLTGLKPKASGKKAPKQTNQVSLAGETGIKIFLAKCCQPQPNDEIKAYITKNRGASIHRENCENLLRIQKKWPQKTLEAAWPKQRK